MCAWVMPACLACVCYICHTRICPCACAGAFWRRCVSAVLQVTHSCFAPPNFSRGPFLFEWSGRLRAARTHTEKSAMGVRPAEVRGCEISVSDRTSQKSPPLPGSAIAGRTRAQPPPPGPGPGGLGPEPAGGGGFNAHWGGWGGPRGRPTRRGLRGGRGGGGVGLGCALGLVRWRVSLFGGFV